MFARALDRMLSHLVQQGDLVLQMAGRPARRYGDGSGPEVSVRLTDPALPRKLLFTPDMALGEAYMDGTMIIGDDDLYGFFDIILTNRGAGRTSAPLEFNLWFRKIIRSILQYNPISRARQNVAHHYDLSGALYELFLDSDKQYSCGYFRDPSDSLEQAQAQKKAYIADKLVLEPGMRVLDVGCGWGGLGLTLARDYGVNVLGVTLSREQHKIAQQRARDEGLEGQVEFRLVDYREVSGRFDRIVSVGMFEHVGVPQYREYFKDIHNLLADDGVALIHTIGRSDKPGSTSPWVLKYIFPGGYAPALSEIMVACEKERLWATDVEVLRLHYAMTLRHWHDRFMARIDEARALYDDRFCRMWRYYLVISEMTFRRHQQVVFQLQLVRNQTAVPLTREYLCP